MTALHWAACNNNVDIISAIVDNTIDIDVKDEVSIIIPVQDCISATVNKSHCPKTVLDPIIVHVHVCMCPLSHFVVMLYVTLENNK